MYESPFSGTSLSRYSPVTKLLHMLYARGVEILNNRAAEKIGGKNSDTR